MKKNHGKPDQRARKADALDITETHPLQLFNPFLNRRDRLVVVDLKSEADLKIQRNERHTKSGIPRLL